MTVVKRTSRGEGEEKILFYILDVLPRPRRSDNVVGKRHNSRWLW